MLRKDREISNRQDIIEILKKCNTLRIGFQGEEYPYVVPVSFGIKADENQCVLYFHGAQKGLKTDLIKKHKNICFESDIFYHIDKLTYGITARYESVIGIGEIQKVQGNEIIEGLKAICGHYGIADFDIDQCNNLTFTDVYKVIVKSMTGKRNLPKMQS